MTFTFEQSKDEIASLVKHFSSNRDQYHAPAYKEAHARQEFIDPLFQALNWDVQNRGHVAPDYREVIVEESLDVEGGRKTPDYAFRIGRECKFFAEAKRPGVNLKVDVSPAYQLRRYAWSAKLPLSILTDFDEFAVYDCRVRPAAGDKASVARFHYLAFTEYPDRWREIWDVFSRDAVWAGSFDQFVVAGRGKHGTSEVDDEFLKEIERWRELLARNIALRNRRLPIEGLNDAVQRIIDRIIFLRMAEDRNLEPYGRLRDLSDQENVYAGLMELCRGADAKYNSGLFDFSKDGDQVTPRLAVEDRVLKSILADLYYPHSPYEFSVLPPEILGNVYEQFLGRVIRLTPSHQARVEEKPEVQKAGGVYYTPAYIVKYIVHGTVGRQVEGKGPKQLQGFRVLDMACGSGSFLLGAYQYLLDHYLAWYSENAPVRHSEAVWRHPDGGWRLTIPEKKRILTEHIFGVDIDRQAVEVTKLSLLLKVLEGEKQIGMFRERALPNLDRNIKCGNSLIAPDYFTEQLMPDAEELRRVNPFDWAAEFPEAARAGGFDCVIGNPPYIDSEWMTRVYPTWRTYCGQRYASAKGNWDLFCVFVEKGLLLCRKSGLSSMIVPNKLLSADYARNLRQFLSRKHTLLSIRDYSNVPVFPVSVYPVIYVAVAHSANASENVLFERMKKAGNGPTSTQKMPWSKFQEANGDSWSNVLNVDASSLLHKIQKASRPLRELASVGGAATVSEAYAYKAFLVEKSAQTKRFFAFVNTGTIDRYALLWGKRPTQYIKQSYEKPVIPERSWGRMSAKRLRETQSAKVIVAGMTKRLECAFDPGGYAAGKSTSVVLSEKVDPLYLLGLLNSRLMSFYYQKKFTGLSLQGGFYRVGPPQLKELPVVIPRTENRGLVEKIVAHVRKMIDLCKAASEAEENSPDEKRLRRLIEANDREIDAFVYELFGLTTPEVEAVEADTPAG
jgi:hypothetical protein